MKQNIILAAMDCGYFRAKSEERKAEALAEVVDTFPETDPTEIDTILVTEVTRRHGVSQKRIASRLKKELEAQDKPVSGGYDAPEIPVIEGDSFVITVAQNNTDLHGGAFSALQHFASSIGARLIVCRTYYNKSGFQHPEHGADADGIFFAPALSPYFVDYSCILGESGALLVGNANVIPTAKNPLSGFEQLGKPGQDVIIPAAKIALQCTAALKGGKGKRFFSTGAVTLRNYIQRKAGQVAESEHSIGAVVVTPTDIRHVEIMPNADGFAYSTTFYNENGSIRPCHPIAIQLGDIHAEKMEEDKLEDIRDMLSELKPRHLILHDLMDFTSRNHHNRKDPIFMFEHAVKGSSVIQDCNKVARLLDTLHPYADQIHVVESNHDLALDRWLKEADPKEDPTNAEFYHAMMYAYCQKVRSGGSFNALSTALSGFVDACDVFGNKLNSIIAGVIFHTTDESVIIAGVEMGHHGHNGINGSKGSPQQYRKLGIPINTGHTHTPSIVGACYTAGVTSSLDMGYNVGASSWRHAHILTYANGQRAIHFD